jgi:hypothetical protein
MEVLKQRESNFKKKMLKTEGFINLLQLDWQEETQRQTTM